MRNMTGLGLLISVSIGEDSETDQNMERQPPVRHRRKEVDRGVKNQKIERL